MAKFNLKKHSSKADMSQPYSKRLSTQNEERKYAIDPSKKSDTIQKMLSSDREDGTNKASSTIENMMTDSRTDIESTISETQIDKRESYIPHRQHKGESRGTIKPNDLLAESYDQKYYERFASKQDAEDTAFWDKQIGVQLSGEKTTIVSQVPAKGSQLQNHPDRFKSIKRESDHVDPADIDQVVKNDREMKSASKLMELDKSIFNIYYKAAKSDRKLTSEEEKAIASISEEKVKILSSEK